MAVLSGGFSTCIQRVNYPIHKGKANPCHGKFFFVGSIPPGCYDENQRSLFYDTEDEAISAARAGGAKRIQRSDYSFA